MFITLLRSGLKVADRQNLRRPFLFPRLEDNLKAHLDVKARNSVISTFLFESSHSCDIRCTH